MNRYEKLLKHVHKEGYGIEIGPSHKPIAPKKSGYKVDVIDCENREQLIHKFKSQGIDVSNIEDVDFVWQGESYAELTGKTDYYDWIIASHVIEHTPDLVGFINDCDTILKEDGILSLAIPDKRYCFDHYRPITGLSKIIDSHFRNSTKHTPGTVAEFLLNAVSREHIGHWDSSTNDGNFALMHPVEKALETMNRVINEDAYLDVHAWCFVPHSFRLIIHDLFSLGLIKLQEIDYYPTTGCEFYITLGRKGKGIEKTRVEILEEIEFEIKEGAAVLDKEVGWRENSFTVSQRLADLHQPTATASTNLIKKLKNKLLSFLQ